MKQFACGAVVPGCQAVFHAPDEQAILAQVADHAHRDHGLTVIPRELVTAVRENSAEVAV
jgi:predicted small metal-binding protein